MRGDSSSAQSALFHGTFRIFLAEALLLPTGLITAAYLTRKFGPADYGLFTLAATIISWIEWTVSSIFARATLKFTAETDDWRPLGTKVVRLHTVAGCLAAAGIWSLSDSVAALLGEPLLSSCLKWFAIDIPLFSIVQAHRNLLVGLGRFNARAVISVVRWLVRLLAVIGLVELGLSVTGAILGSVVATIVELSVARYYIQPSLLQSSDFPLRKLWDYVLPLFMFAFRKRIYEKLDLVLLKPMGGTIGDTGFYGAAQNLSLVVSLFSLSFAPLVLSGLSSMLSAGETEKAKELGRISLRIILALFPFAAMSAGASDEIVGLIFGPMFQETAPILARLIFSGVLLAGISVVTAILTAFGRPGLTFALTGPKLPISLVGYLLMIPRGGAIAAANVNLAVTFVGTIATLAALHRICGILPPALSVVRAVLISCMVYFIASWWPAHGWLLVLKLLCLSMMIGFALVISGEVPLRDFFRFKKVFSNSTNPDLRES